MTIRIPCKRCTETIVAIDKDDVVRQVEEHARDDGGWHGKHVPKREQILGPLRGGEHRHD